MRILLIRPAQIRWHDEAGRVGTPTGLLSIAAALRREHDVTVIDAVAEGYQNESEIKEGVIRFGLDDDAILQRIDELRPDVIGISNLFTLYWGVTAQLVLRIKTHAPAIITIVGGHHASEAAMEIMELDQRRSIDYIAIRESENTITELLRVIENGGDPATVPGIAYRDQSGSTRTSSSRPLIMSIDELDDPAWDLIDIRNYSAEMSHHGPCRGANFIDVSFSRGCPIGCHFCTSTSYWGSRFRVFSERRVHAQLARIAALGWNEIVVEDDNFSALPFEVQRQICRALKATGLPWCNDGGLYLPLLDEKRVALLAETGCYRVFLPVETPSVQMIQAQHKYRSIRGESDFLRQIEHVTTLLRDARIEFYSALMVGFPADTADSIRHACNFADYLIGHCGAFGVAFHWVHDYPGTENYRRALSRRPAWHESPETYTFTRPDPVLGWARDVANELRTLFPQPSRVTVQGSPAMAPRDHTTRHTR